MRSLEDWRDIALFLEAELLRQTQSRAESFDGLLETTRQVQEIAQGALKKLSAYRGAMKFFDDLARQGRLEIKPPVGLAYPDRRTWAQRVDDAMRDMSKLAGTPAGREAYRRLMEKRHPAFVRSKAKIPRAKGEFARRIWVAERPIRTPARPRGRPVSADGFPLRLLEAIEKHEPSVHENRRLKHKVTTWYRMASKRDETRAASIYSMEQEAEHLYQQVKDAKKKRDRQRNRQGK